MSFFTPRFEFVGIDIDVNDNRPVLSKTPLLEMWKTKQPSSIRDFVSFIGLIEFYRKWIPFFDARISYIRSLMANHDYNNRLTTEDITPQIHDEMLDLLNVVLSDHILQWADIKKWFYIRTDVCSRSHGNVLLQSGDDAASPAAMNREINGVECEFELTRASTLKLHPLGFAARKYTKNGKFLHSFMMEALGMNFVI